MEVSEYLVGSPAFKAGDTGDPRMAGSIPVHLRCSSQQGETRPAAVGALILLVVLIMWAAPAGAQARLLSSSPEDGASVDVLRTVEFEFDSLLNPAGAEVTVTKLDGTSFPVEAQVDGTTLIGTVVGDLPSGNYEVAYSVRSADGDINTGALRIGVDSPEQALSGGGLAVIGIACGLLGYLALVFRADKRRRPNRN